jgi:hypothetical protein
MKKIAFIICAMWLFVSSASFGQYSETSMVPVLNDAEDYLEEIKGETVTIVRMEFDLIFSDAPKTTYRDFYSHREYTVMAFGDSKSIADIDVKILKYDGSQWVDYLQDNSSKSMAKIVFTPPEDGNYRIDIEVFTFKEEYDRGHYGLIVYYK